jgi:hypothetical protein
MLSIRKLIDISLYAHSMSMGSFQVELRFGWALRFHLTLLSIHRVQI